MHDCGILCTTCSINVYAYLCVYMYFSAHISLSVHTYKILCTCTVCTLICTCPPCPPPAQRPPAHCSVCQQRSGAEEREELWSCLYYCTGRDKVHRPEGLEEVIESIPYEVPPRWNQIGNENILCRANEVPIEGQQMHLRLQWLDMF